MILSVVASPKGAILPYCALVWTGRPIKALCVKPCPSIMCITVHIQYLHICTAINIVLNI